MSEPTERRTTFGRAGTRPLARALRRHSALAAILSLLGAFALLTAPTLASATTDGRARQAIESSKAASNLLIDIARAGERLVVAGDRGHILYSDDDGASWTQARVPTRQLLTAITFVDERHGWAVGHDALVLATSDGGESWTVQYEEREREAPLLGVWFADAQHGLAIGAYGALIETRDGGRSWNDVSERLDNEDGFHLNAIAEVRDSGLLIVGEMGAMFRSADAGETWQRLESPYEGSYFGVLGGAEPGVVIAFGLRGHLFRSADFGDSWEAVELANGNGHPLESGLAGGALLHDGRIVVVGHGGAVLVSADQGRSFTLHNRPDRRSLSGVSADSRGNLLLVGQGGVRLATPSGADPGPQQ